MTAEEPTEAVDLDFHWGFAEQETPHVSRGISEGMNKQEELNRNLYVANELVQLFFSPDKSVEDFES